MSEKGRLVYDPIDTKNVAIESIGYLGLCFSIEVAIRYSEYIADGYRRYLYYAVVVILAMRWYSSVRTILRKFGTLMDEATAEKFTEDMYRRWWVSVFVGIYLVFMMAITQGGIVSIEKLSNYGSDLFLDFLYPAVRWGCLILIFISAAYIVNKAHRPSE